ncbi:MAG: MurR/RpiR family transcriptional regulator, partial [Rhizobiaceae bacterium]|nr:MurR/RpiR family transcriptional regulator [Rhizobiaceae bacterium]
MSQIADIITRLQMMTQEGSKSDRKLAALVLSDLDFASKAAISEIASRAEVSEPTVTRFCRNLGCEGVRDFKFWLAQAIAIGGLYLMPAPVSRDVREQRIANAITAGATQAIERMAAGLDMATLMSVAETLSVSKQILCIGSGGTSSMMATEMQNRLFRLGLSVVSQVDGQLQRMYAAVVSSETTVIGFSISGYAKSVVDSIALARQYGAKTVAITGAGSALAKAAEVVIPFQHLEDSNIYKPTSARYALLAIVDMIATATAESRDSKVLE